MDNTDSIWLACIPDMMDTIESVGHVDSIDMTGMIDSTIPTEPIDIVGKPTDRPSPFTNS